MTTDRNVTQQETHPTDGPLKPPGRAINESIHLQIQRASILPRYVAAIRNDGCGDFAVSGKLTNALAEADVDTLRRLATSWTERLTEDGEDTTIEHAVALLRDLARLAAAVPRKAGGVYCWHM